MWWFSRSELEELDCPTCGIKIGVQKTLADRRRKDGKDFWCPSGHAMSFVVAGEDSALLKANKALAAATKRAETLAAWVKRAPHLATCNVRVDRPCDCGRVECVGDVAAPEVTSAN